MVTKKNLYNPGRVLDINAKNEVDPIIGLGGVRPPIDRQTHTQNTYGYYSIDTLHIKFIFWSGENVHILWLLYEYFSLNTYIFSLIDKGKHYLTG